MSYIVLNWKTDETHSTFILDFHHTTAIKSSTNRQRNIYNYSYSYSEFLIPLYDHIT